MLELRPSIVWVRGMEGTYGELAEDVVICLGWVWVASHGAFDDCQSQRPDIGLNGVCPATWVRASLRDSTT